MIQTLLPPLFSCNTIMSTLEISTQHPSNESMSAISPDKWQFIEDAAGIKNQEPNVPWQNIAMWKDYMGSVIANEPISNFSEDARQKLFELHQLLTTEYQTNHRT